ncbi:hypothetical protein PP1Y_Spl11 (plasmid) [Novosphingobium sp. PP1Y]|nr:hypothetical protein PP1Y_Spl11 [Novosphingobium sp. PP1Y]
MRVHCDPLSPISTRHKVEDGAVTADHHALVAQVNR